MTNFKEAEEQFALLEESLESSGAMVSAFQNELMRMQNTMLLTNREVSSFSKTIGSSFKNAFDGVVFDGLKLSDALKNITKSMIDGVYNIAFKPIQSAVGGVVAGGINSALGNISLFEKGGAFTQGRVMPFAKGGVVSSPTSFPMKGGTGLMGEAGAEAIMPLTRGADGRLGVAASGGGGRPVNVIMNINTQDAASFKKSQTQLAADVARAMARGQRNR